MHLYWATVRVCSLHDYQRSQNGVCVLRVEQKQLEGFLYKRVYRKGFSRHPHVWKCSRSIHRTQDAARPISWTCYSCMIKVYSKIMKGKVMDWVWKTPHIVFIKPCALSIRLHSIHSCLSNKIARVYEFSSVEAHCCRLQYPTCLLGPGHVSISA